MMAGALPKYGIAGAMLPKLSLLAPVAVALGERLDLGVEVVGQEVVFQQAAVLYGLVPAVDFTLRLGMELRAAHREHSLGPMAGMHLRKAGPLA